MSRKSTLGSIQTIASALILSFSNSSLVRISSMRTGVLKPPRYIKSYNSFGRSEFVLGNGATPLGRDERDGFGECEMDGKLERDGLGECMLPDTLESEALGECPNPSPSPRPSADGFLGMGIGIAGDPTTGDAGLLTNEFVFGVMGVLLGLGPGSTGSIGKFNPVALTLKSPASLLVFLLV